MDENVSINEIRVLGRLISLHANNDGSAIITVLTRNGKDVFIRFYCAPGKLPELERHARICVIGHVNCFSRRTDAGYRNVQQFVADKVYKDTTMTEKKYGVAGRFFAPFSCEIYIKGVVRSVTSSGNDWLAYNVEVDGDKDDMRPSVVKLNMKKVDRQPEINAGDVIYTVCSLSTPKKVLDGETVYFSNIVISDIAVA